MTGLCDQCEHGRRNHDDLGCLFCGCRLPMGRDQ